MNLFLLHLLTALVKQMFKKKLQSLFKKKVGPLVAVLPLYYKDSKSCTLFRREFSVQFGFLIKLKIRLHHSTCHKHQKFDLSIVASSEHYINLSHLSISELTNTMLKRIYKVIAS